MTTTAMPARPAMRWLRRAVLGAAGTAAIVVGLGALAHTPFGKPLLRVLRGAACPIPFGVSLTPEASEAARQRALLPFKGEVRASGHPALGFVLGETTRDDVARWASTRGLACHPDGATTLTCKDIPAGALPAPYDAKATSVSLRWNAAGTLVAAVTTRAGIAPDEAARMTDAITTDVARNAGSPTLTIGVPTAAYLDVSLRQVRNEFRYRDYRAEVIATRFGSEVVVSEEYQSIADLSRSGEIVVRARTYASRPAPSRGLHPTPRSQ